MATRARATIPLLFLLATGLLFAAAVGASREEEEGRRGEHWLRQCEQRCQKDRPRYQRAECVQECRQEQHKWEQEQEQGRGGRGDREREGKEREQAPGQRGERAREGEEQQESRRPYVFGPRSFQRIVRSEQGFIKALRPFNEESRLLRGIKNYRVAILEANPRSFVVPGYTDAHSICYVAQGEGVLTLVENGEKRSYAVRQGDVVVAPAGSLMHLANTDGRRKLVIAKILHTISVPGKFELFSAESLVSSLSQRVQRAAFKTSPQRLEKVFGRRGQKKKGSILRASEEQIRELRQQASEGGQSPHWPLPPFGGDSRATYNLLQQRPTIANRHGRLYEADARSFRALADHDVRVAFANISAGSMTAPYYNTQSVKIAVVLEGEGEVEIVCPHLSQDSERRRSEEGQSERGKGRWREEEEDDERERQQQRRGRRGESESESEEQQHEQEKYETVRARVSRGSVFVVPPGHPVVEISSSRGSSNLQVVCFEIRAENNDRVFLAGKNNVLGKLDKPAKELAFGAPEREVDEVLGAQQEEGFLAGPEQQQERGEEEWRHRGDRGRGEEAVESLLRMATGAF